MINNNFNNYNNQAGNISYGAVKDVVPQDINQKLPENIQNLDAKEIANSNGAVSAMGGISPKSIAATLPVYGAFVGLRTINDRKGIFGFAGEYEKSFLGKLAKIGDSISGVFSKLIPNSIKTTAPAKFEGAKNFILKHSAFARSASTPLKLENSFARSDASGLFGRVINDDAILFEKGFKGGRDALINMFKGDGSSTLWKELQKGGIETASDEGAKKLVQDLLKKLYDMSNCDTGAKHISKAVGDEKYIRECTTDLIKALSKSDQKFVIDKWGKFPIGKIPVIGKLFTLNVPANEMANKLRVAAKVSPDELGLAATGAAAAGTTVLGRALPNVFAKVYEGLTSDYVGGKIAPIMQAFFIAQAGMKAKEAPKGKKVATFADEAASSASYLITMPIATSILTKAGGTLKYVGMGKTVQEQTQNVKKFREMVRVLNDKVDAGSITRGEYVNEVKNIKKVLNGDTKFWQKPFKALGKIIGSNYKGETIKPFVGETIPSDMGKLKTIGLQFSDKVQKFMYNFKTGKFMGMTPGGVLRLALVMFVLSPLVTKPIKWVVNKIFGEPYDANKEKEEQAKKAQAEAMKNNPFANMSDKELMDLLSKNQNTLMQIQNNPQLMQEIQNNPQKLYDILKQGAMEADAARVKAGPSPLLQSYLNNKGVAQQIQPSNGYNPQMQQMNGFNSGLNQNNMNTNAQMPVPTVQTPQNSNNGSNNSNNFIEPQRSYIPSSKPADFSQQQSIESQRLNAVLLDMENTEKEYSQYLNI